MGWMGWDPTKLLFLGPASSFCPPRKPLFGSRVPLPCLSKTAGEHVHQTVETPPSGDCSLHFLLSPLPMLTATSSTTLLAIPWPYVVGLRILCPLAPLLPEGGGGRAANLGNITCALQLPY